MANYKRQDFNTPVIGTSTSPAVLFETFEDSGVIHIGGAESVTLLIAYTMGTGESGNSIDLQYEISSDGVTYYPVPNITFSSGAGTWNLRADTFAATQSAGTYDYYAITLTDIQGKSLKISAKESGTIDANAGSCYISAIIAGR